ncbi:MAG: hypothetical protein ACYCVH_16235 [Ignavibacteriaceae bacterium]
MKTYRVGLSRLYNVSVAAENEKDAKEAVDTFISDPKDISTKKDRIEYHFKITEIEMTENEAFEIEEIKANE